MAALAEVGVDAPKAVVFDKKLGKKVLKHTFSKKNADVLALQDDRRSRYIIQARFAAQSTKLVAMAKKMRNHAAVNGGRVPVYLKYYGAHTGRPSGANRLNLTNLPRYGGVRETLEAPPGHLLVMCDSSNIEARMLAYLSNCTHKLEEFKAGKDPYERTASAIAGHPVTKADDPKARDRGKVVELLCLSGDTKVLTDTGYKKLIDISLVDLLWDGQEWVQHEGVIYQGEKPVINYFGIICTTKHKFLSNGEMHEAEQYRTPDEVWQSDGEVLCRNPKKKSDLCVRMRLRDYCAEARFQFKCWAKKWSQSVLWLPTKVASPNAWPITYKILSGVEQYDSSMLKPGEQKISPIRWQGDWLRSALAQVCEFCRRYAEIVFAGTPVRQDKQHSWLLSRKLQVGNAKSERQKSRTYGYGNDADRADAYNRHSGKMGFECRHSTKANSQGRYRRESSAASKSESCFDIVNAGPRNRFTVLGDFPMITSNSGYQGSGRSLRAQMRAGAMGTPRTEISEKEAARYIAVYRKTNYQIPKFWYRLNDFLPYMNSSKMVFDPITNLSFGQNSIKTMADTWLRFPNLHLAEPDDSGYDSWLYGERPERGLYGGKICENLCQHLAWRVVLEQLKKAVETLPGEVVLTVYDEIVMCVPENDAHETRLGLIDIMSESPSWAPDLPIAAEADISLKYKKA